MNASSAHVHRMHAHLLRAANRPREAAEAMSRCIKTGGSSPGAYLDRANMWAVAGKIPRSLSDFGQALHLASQDTSLQHTILVRRGLVHLEQGDVGSAEQDACKVLQRHEHNAEGIALLAKISLRKGEFVEAHRLIKMSADLDPDNVTVLLAQGVINEAQERFPMALACYNRALDIEPDCFEARFENGSV